MLTVIAAKAALLGLLTDSERSALAALMNNIRELRPGQDIALEGDVSRNIAFLLSGIACSYKSVEGGARQITAFHVPGDMFGFTSLIFHRLSNSSAAITECKIAFVTHDTLNTVIERVPSLTRILWRETVAQSAVGREWMARIGRCSARERIAHLLCEIAFRLQAIGAIDDCTKELPLTQLVLGDATGLSVVHVNRIIQGLRMQKLVKVRAGKIWILDWQGLSDVARFRSEYLHLGK
jgi:CRP-like cAMP-binding protein